MPPHAHPPPPPHPLAPGRAVVPLLLVPSAPGPSKVYSLGRGEKIPRSVCFMSDGTKKSFAMLVFFSTFNAFSNI